MLGHHNQLVKGSKAFGLKYGKDNYACYSEKARQAVSVEAEWYLAHRQLPPPRVLVLGARGSGKHYVTEKMRVIHEIPTANFRDLIVKVNPLHVEGSGVLQEHVDQIFKILNYEEVYLANSSRIFQKDTVLSDFQRAKTTRNCF